MTEKLEEARTSIGPKRKFGFKNKLQVTSSSKSKDSALLGRGTLPEQPNVQHQASVYEGSGTLSSNYPPQDNVLKITQRSSEFIQPKTTSSLASEHSSAQITETSSCIVNLAARLDRDAPLANVQISRARQSLFLCGSVRGPVFTSNSSDCVVVTTCGQLRLHQCKNCVVYLYCSSKPVIEGCTGIKFAPLPDYFVSSFSTKFRSHSVKKITSAQ